MTGQVKLVMAYANGMEVICRPSLDSWEKALSREKATVATGHQAWLWHPGILAKDWSAIEASKRWEAKVLHLVVDHDVNEAGRFTFPRKEGSQLFAETVQLVRQQTGVPTGMQAAQPINDWQRNLEQVKQKIHPAYEAGVQRLLDALPGLSKSRTLAEQVTQLQFLVTGLADAELDLCYSSDFAREKAFLELVQHMVDDASRCVQTYNRATLAYPQAGIAALHVDRERIELPLWWLQWGQPRQRVFVDIADTKPMLVTETGEQISIHEPTEDEPRLAPKAILLSAYMRTRRVNLFIHGLGGETYDLVTEAWWQQWRDEELNARAIVSANVYLPFKEPVATVEDLCHEIWRAHWLPHNMDRALQLQGESVNRKWQLIQDMDMDRNRQRRKKAWQEINAINHALVECHTDVIEKSQAALEQARVGLKNKSVSNKRDWPAVFNDLEQLSHMFHSREQEHANTNP